MDDARPFTAEKTSAIYGSYNYETVLNLVFSYKFVREFILVFGLTAITNK